MTMTFGGDRGRYPRGKTAYPGQRPNRKNSPTITLYFINEDEPQPPCSLSCMYCKRTISDRVVGQIDYGINASTPTPPGATAHGILCQLCGQRYRIVSQPTTNT